MKTVGILGMGVEGQSATRYFLNDPSHSIIAIDRTGAPADGRSTLGRLTWAPEDLSSLDGLSFLLRSPGIFPNHPLVVEAERRGLSVTTPTGYWLQTLAPAETITVTGTKGKSTTVGLLSHLLRALGEDATALGNIGAPPLDHHPAVMAAPVIELSSYMMHDLPMTGHLHVVTNLYREHTTWHGTEDAYRAAKLRPFRHGPSAPGIAQQSLIDTEQLPSSVAAVETLVQHEGQRLTADGHSVRPEDHNPAFQSLGAIAGLQMALAAALSRHSAAEMFAALPDALSTFQGLPHRQTQVPSTDGREWIDDALATVPQATMAALDRWKGRKITLLLGGADRGQDFASLADFIRTRPEISVLGFGSVQPKLACAFQGEGADFTATDSFEKALEIATSTTPRGGVVLFSPSAATEPPHTDYKHRGALFAAAAAAA